MTRGPFLHLAYAPLLVAACGGQLTTPRSQDAGAPQPMAPCTTTADCGSPYLKCAPQMVSTCRQSGAASDAASSILLCPTTVQVTEDLCSVSYQLPCQTDADCGPAGFVCQHGPCGLSINGVEVADCQQREATGGRQCSTENDCPQGWLCGNPCACTQQSAGPGGTCIPPFAVFSCPACGFSPVDGGSG